MRACILSGSDRQLWTSFSLEYFSWEGSYDMELSPKMRSTCSRSISPWRAQAEQKSSLTLSVYGLLLRDSSNMSDAVGKTLVSTCGSAWVMQNSAEGVEKPGGHSWASIRGTLFIKKDRSSCASLGPSFLKTAFASRSKDAKIRSTALC